MIYKSKGIDVLIQIITIIYIFCLVLTFQRQYVIPSYILLKRNFESKSNPDFLQELVKCIGVLFNLISKLFLK